MFGFFTRSLPTAEQIATSIEPIVSSELHQMFGEMLHLNKAESWRFKLNGFIFTLGLMYCWAPGNRRIREMGLKKVPLMEATTLLLHKVEGGDEVIRIGDLVIDPCDKGPLPEVLNLQLGLNIKPSDLDDARLRLDEVVFCLAQVCFQRMAEISIQSLKDAQHENRDPLQATDYGWAVMLRGQIRVYHHELQWTPESITTTGNELIVLAQFVRARRVMVYETMDQLFRGRTKYHID